MPTATPVLLVIWIDVLDSATYAEYVERVPATVYRYGGRYLARGTPTPGFGDWRPERMIIMEFPSRERLQQWAHSPEYLEIKGLRDRATRTRSVSIDVLPDQPGPAAGS